VSSPSATGKSLAPFIALGEELRQLDAAPDEVWLRVMARAAQENPWFTVADQKAALGALGRWMLDAGTLREWAGRYGDRTASRPVTVGVIMAGNIPAAGFHDLMAVLVAGHAIRIKASRDDTVLMQHLAHRLAAFDPSLEARIVFVDKLTGADAYIGTGSDNSARYFEYYFRDRPHVIRRNRNGVAVLSGNETDEDLAALGEDIFRYFGLGCRSVAKLYVPQDYSFGAFFRAMTVFSGVMQHNKYMNNYDYRNTVFLLNKQPFLTNDFLIVMEEAGFSSPVSVLHYERYNDPVGLPALLATHADRIQCVAGPAAGGLPFGTSQQPRPWDYADGVDTMDFLLGLG